MQRSFPFFRTAWLVALVAVGACGRAAGRPDAGAGGDSTTGAGGGAGSGGASSGGGGGGGIAGTGGTSTSGTAGVGGSGGVGVAGSGGAGVDGGNDRTLDAGDAVADASDAAREGGTQTPECLAKNGFEYRVILIGAGFDAYEGRTLVAVTTDSRSNPCRASGTTTIRDGAFQIELVNLAATNYPTVDAFIDLDDDGRCSDSVDAKWQVTLTASRGIGPVIRNLTPTNFSVPGNCAISSL